MSKKKLIQQLQRFFDLELRRQTKHRHELLKILKKLKKKADKIAEKLENEKDPGKIALLQQDLKVISAQREKGKYILREQSKSAHCKREES